jgi:PKD repeat protein
MPKKLTAISVFGVMTFICLIIFAAPQPVHAHFMIKDGGTDVKASFHVTPDHDPIAGKTSVISFDFSKTKFRAQDFSYTLNVKSTKDEAVDVSIEAASNVILASYVFPKQGFYTIELTATSKRDGRVSKLQYGQRVSRGNTEEKRSISLLENAIIISTVIVVTIVLIVGFKDDMLKLKRKK